MSLININNSDHETSDEDESYKQRFKSKIESVVIVDESIIDMNSQSESETSTDNTDTESILHHDTTNVPTQRLKSYRESSILPIKRKPVRLIDSDDDDDAIESNSLSNSTMEAIENASTKLIEDTFSNQQQHSMASGSKDPFDLLLETRPQQQHSMASGSKDPFDLLLETRPQQQPRQQHSMASGSKDPFDLLLETRPQKNSLTIYKPANSDSDSSHEISVSTEEQDSSSASQQIEEDEPDDNMNLSAEIRKKRLTQQFGYNSEGILNSTAITQGEQNRMPSNFSAIQETIENASSDSSVEILSDHDSDIIEVSSGEELLSPKKTPFKLPIIKSAIRQQTLYPFLVKGEATTPQPKIGPVQSEQISQREPLAVLSPRNQQEIPRQSPTAVVSQAAYEQQLNKVNNLEMDYVKLQSMTEQMNLEELPDKGKLVKESLKSAENKYKQEKHKLDRMEISNTMVDEAPQGAAANVAWEDIEAGANAVLPKTFGKTAMSTYNAQKVVTLDRLQQLHEALQACPKEDDLEEDPKGIKVPLMPHQKRALAWIMFREKEKPSGGILADDMGLGKTLTMIALVVKSLQLEESNEENQYVDKHTKYNGGTLVVCPASLINQWSGEIDRRLKRGRISYYLYHGPNRETRPKKLAQYDVVITTYAIINNESDKMSASFRIKWRRVILDEAHTIRNHKAQTSVACCQLLARSRWALTGTPMHNKELDMYALLKFLRCSPFDDLQVWKRWVGDKSSGGMERLHTVISSLMLRRTKAELMAKGALNSMPEKHWELINVQLDENEMRVYHKVMIFSQTLFAQFLHQRAEKNQDFIDQKYTEDSNKAPNEEYFKMRKRLMKLNKVKDVSQHEILVLLLRLRQICCHPSLISAMLDESRDDVGEEDEESEELNLLDQLEKLNIEDDDEHQPNRQSLGDVAQDLADDNKITLKQASKGHLHPSDPVFATDRISSKIKAMLRVLRKKVLVKDDKAIIVSQWSSYLKLVAIHLEKYNIEFDQLDGSVPVSKRMAMVDRINNPRDDLQVLLLSLTAGGVGLNLVGANHLFLLDLHWNPQLENQAQDRIYRVGQTKPVFVYKFMATDTIEERIKALQDKKLAIAEGLLTGTKQEVQSKLSLQDLRMIFGM